MSEGSRRGNEAKESILVLCRILKYSDAFESLSPDDVRLAKFDKPEAIDVLVHLLYALLQEPILTTSSKLCSKLEKLRYPRSACLLGSDGTFKSSRELLLAIAWFIHVTKFIDVARNNACKPVDIRKLFIDKQKKTFKSMNKSSTTGLNCVTEKVSRLTWSLSQLSLIKQELISILMGNESMKAKLCMGSPLELKEDPLLLLILKTPSLCHEYERLFERKILLLQSCIQWRKLQGVFWLWMDSVLTSATETKAPTHSSMNPLLAINPLSTALKENLVNLQRQVKEQRLLYPRSDYEVVTGCLSPELKLLLDKEVQGLQLRLLNPHYRPSLEQTHRDSSSMQGMRETVRIETEIQRVIDINDIFLGEIKMLRCGARSRFEALAGGFDRAVLINPDVPQRCRSQS